MIALVRLLLAFLALIGFYVPGNRLYDCRDRKPPLYAPQGCQVVTVRPAATVAKVRIVRESDGLAFAGVRAFMQNAAS